MIFDQIKNSKNESVKFYLNEFIECGHVEYSNSN